MVLLKIMNRFLAELEKMVLAGGIIGLSLLVFMNVLMRFVFNWAWVGEEEVSKFIIIWITFLGTSMGARKGIHITMSAFFDKLPPKIKKAVYMGISLVTAALSIILTVFGWQLTYLAYRTEQVSPALMIPVWPVYSIFPVGFFLTAIQFTRVFLKNLKEEKLILGPEEEEKKEWLDY